MKHHDSEELKVNWREILYNKNISIQSYERLSYNVWLPLVTSQHPKFLLLQHEGLLLLRLWPQADRMCFVLINDNNVFQDNHV